MGWNSTSNYITQSYVRVEEMDGAFKLNKEKVINERPWILPNEETLVYEGDGINSTSSSQEHLFRIAYERGTVDDFTEEYNLKGPIKIQRRDSDKDAGEVINTEERRLTDHVEDTRDLLNEFVDREIPYEAKSPAMDEKDAYLLAEVFRLSDVDNYPGFGNLEVITSEVEMDVDFLQDRVETEIR